MDRREEELRMLSGQILDSLKQLPQDGQERQVTISVGGGNHGSIHVGSVVNINPVPPRPRELHEMESHELLKIKRNLQIKSKDAKWRYYLNIPSVLLLTLVSSAFSFALWNIFLLYNYGMQANLLILNEKSIVVFVSWALCVTLCGKLMDRTRKIENCIVVENQSIIDAISVILRRRDY